MRNSTPLLCYVDLLAETALTSSDVKGECSGEPGDNLVTTLYFSLVRKPCAGLWFYIMASKRKFCEHCEEYVTLRTHRLHADLYCHKTSEEVYSSEEEEIAGDDFEDVNVDRNMEYEGIEATSQGTENVVDKLPKNLFK